MMQGKARFDMVLGAFFTHSNSFASKGCSDPPSGYEYRG